ncbi:MAG: TatD family hydrolase [Eubacterium sp.]|nr:TatD family hydrolase [Eubacterium sp.]
MKIFDSHAHYDDRAFDEDRYDLIERLKSENVARITNIGSSMETSKSSIALADRYHHIYAAIGVHPSECEDMTEDDLEELREMSKHDKVVAIGEIGLDHYYPEPGKELQEIWFRKQLRLARELGLPVVIHSRDAAEDTVRVMKEEAAQDIGGVVHCYSYSAELAKVFLNMDFYIGVGGVLTFNNGRKLRETVEILPLDKIVIETDCPYLSPVPLRGKRNDSGNLKYVISKLAEIKGMTEEKIAEVTYENACRLYRINK